MTVAVRCAPVVFLSNVTVSCELPSRPLVGVILHHWSPHDAFHVPAAVNVRLIVPPCPSAVMVLDKSHDWLVIPISAAGLSVSLSSSHDETKLAADKLIAAMKKNLRNFLIG